MEYGSSPYSNPLFTLYRLYVNPHDPMDTMGQSESAGKLLFLRCEMICTLEDVGIAWS